MATVNPAASPGRVPSGTLRCTVLFILGFLICCIAGRALSFPGIPFATFWPASGMYLAVLRLAERRDLPRLIAAAVIANFFFDVVLQNRHAGQSLLFCAANTVEAAVGASLLCVMRRRVTGLSQLQDFMGLAVAGVLSAAIGASRGLLTTYLFGSPNWDVRWWLIWWSADLIGILLAGPVVLSWWSPTPAVGATLRSPLRLAELAVLLAGIVLTVWRVEGREEFTVRALPFGVLPLLVWAAVRYGVRGSSLSLVVFFAAMVQVTIDGRGLYAIGNEAPVVRFAALQMSTAMVAFAFLSLASVMDDRNRALNDARLSREAAERANAAKSQFLANMSHELRTPMNGILGMTDLVLRGELSSLQREQLGLARRSADSLLALLNDILDLSKVEAGRLELRPAEFPLRATLDEIVRLIEPQSTSKGVALACCISPDVPDWLRADKDRLRQVLLNLLGNAVKFMHQGHIRLDVDVASRADAVRLLHFCVSDTGIGISADAQQRMFSRFEQAHAGDYGGTGLGLSIVQQLVALMGGRIWVESESGRGSQFHFTIETTAAPQPAANDDVQDVRNAGVDRDDDSPAVSPSFDTGRAVLLVEDDPISSLVARTVLENAGFSVTVANHGGEAVELWRARQFDCVLSDMRMPVMNGLELARVIRNDEHRSAHRTPIIILTASARAGDDVACRTAGIDAYLTKPVRSEELLGVIRQLGVDGPPTGVP